MIEKEEGVLMRRVERQKKVDDDQVDSETQKDTKAKRRKKTWICNIIADKCVVHLLVNK